MSSQRGRRPKPLTAQQLKKLLTEAIEEGSYRETLHATFDHVERQIDLNDVLFGLTRPWKFGSDPKFDEEFWNWKYEISAKDIEGRPLTIIVAVDPQIPSFEVLTRWIEE